MSQNQQIASPVKEMPDCWEDDKRMNVLFSPFRKREVNPIDYDSKMKFWNNIIINWCLENNQSLVTLTNLRNAFKRKGREPACLMEVIEELLKNGDLKSKKDFLNMSVAESTWTGWAINRVKSPFFWSFTKLKDALAEIDLNEVPYVYLEYIKIKSDEILKNAELSSEKSLYTIEEIRKLIEPECNLETAELFLHWLKVKGKACTVTCGDHELIKLSTKQNLLQVTDRDIAQFKLIKSKESLVHAITYLEMEKEKAISEAKGHLAKGLRIAAKSSLRKKKALEECLTKRISTLDNLDLLITRIKDAQSDAEVFSSYKIGVAALKSTFKVAELTEDTALDTINDMEEINEMQDEIQNALAHQIQPITESELEDELSMIMSNVKLDDDEAILPEVPTTNIPEIQNKKETKTEPIKILTE